MSAPMGRMYSDAQFAGRNSASVTTQWCSYSRGQKMGLFSGQCCHFTLHGQEKALFSGRCYQSHHSPLTTHHSSLLPLITLTTHHSVHINALCHGQAGAGSYSAQCMGEINTNKGSHWEPLFVYHLP